MLQRLLAFLVCSVTSSVWLVAGGDVTLPQHRFERPGRTPVLDDYRPDRVIAKPRAAVSAAELARHEGGEGLQVRARWQRAGGTRLLELTATTENPLNVVERLRASGLYEYVEPDYVRYRLATPNDPRFAEQWGLRNTGGDGGTAGADISAVPGWDVRSSTSSVIVAVLDSGIRVTHEDLAANLWVNTKEVAGNGIDEDGNGYIDDVHGINSLAGQGQPGSGNPADTDGHGTAVAGVIGAVGDNGKGITGVAWGVKLMALKFDDDDPTQGNASVSKAIECIEYAITHGAKVINVSYGGRTFSFAEYEALKRARDHGIIVVAAAGNDGQSNEHGLSFPASYPLDNILAVANSTRSDTLAPSSTYGSLVELAAPGTNILTLGHKSDSDYTTMSGTSFAAPMVSGSLALLRAQFPDDTHRQSINRLLRSVDKKDALRGRVATGGRLNLAAALGSTSNRPFNDDFAGRSVVEGESVLLRASSLHATAETGEPVIGDAAGKSVWWSWTAPRTGQMTMDTQGSDFDTQIAVFTGSSLSQLNLVGMNDDAPGRTTSRLTVSITQGTTYHIAVSGKNGASGFILLALGIPPPNDNFAAAEVLTGVSAQTVGLITNASSESGEPVLPDIATAQGTTVWYRWVAPRRSHFTVAVGTDSFAPVIGIYEGDTLGSLTLVASREGAAWFEARAGRTYHFKVDSSSLRAGAFILSLLEADGAIRLGYSMHASVAFSRHGALVSVSDRGVVVQIAPDGESWVLPVKGEVDVATPAVAADGSVYVTTSRGLFAISKLGQLKWEKLVDEGFSGSPAVASDGTVLAHSDDGWLHAYTPAGKRRWRVRVPGISYASPVVAPNGTIYLGSDDGHVYAISAADGAQRWRLDTGGAVYSSVAIGGDGTLYVGNLGGRFVAINPDGTEKWRHQVGTAISSSACIGPDGTLYFGARDGKLYALRADGTLRWTYGTGDEIRGSSPAIDSGGTVYIGSYDLRLHAVNANGTLKQTYPTGGIIRSSPMVDDEFLLFGSGDGNVYFIYTGAVLAPTPWPMHRQNPERTGRRHSTSSPTIHTQPRSRTIATGGSATLSVNADGEDPMSFQWYHNGTAIAGATDSSYTIENAGAGAEGEYSVVVSNGKGTTTSTAAVVKVVTASKSGRIVNLSARTIAGRESKTLIVGFVIGTGQGSKELLVRGVGPTLSGPPYNVPGVLVDPKLTVYNGNTAVDSNDDWSGNGQISLMNERVGAFGLASSTSKDAALITHLAPGSYTAHVTAASGNDSGVALAEFYDGTAVFTADTPRLVNISARSEVGKGADILILGFVVAGEAPCQVLIRAIGPTLGEAPYNVPGVLANPKLEIRDSKQSLIAENDDWGTQDAAELASVMSRAGAFALSQNSKDAAVVVTLSPGAYTALVRGVGDTTGVALAEVYQVD